MRLFPIGALLAILPIPALSGLNEVVLNHIQPGYAALAAETSDLAEAAGTCDRDAIKAAYHDAYDSWMGISHVQFGPVESRGLALAISFWPDPKNHTGKAIGKLISTEDPIVADPEAFPDVSVAARGFPALERLLFDIDAADPYACQLIGAISLDLATNAAVLAEDWKPMAQPS